MFFLFFVLYIFLFYSYYLSLRPKRIAILSSNKDLIDLYTNKFENNEKFVIVPLNEKKIVDCRLDYILIITEINHEKFKTLNQSEYEYDILYELSTIRSLIRPKISIFIINDKDTKNLRDKYSYYLCLYRIQIYNLYKNLKLFNNIEDSINYLIE